MEIELSNQELIFNLLNQIIIDFYKISNIATNDRSLLGDDQFLHQFSNKWDKTFLKITDLRRNLTQEFFLSHQLQIRKQNQMHLFKIYKKFKKNNQSKNKSHNNVLIQKFRQLIQKEKDAAKIDKLYTYAQELTTFIEYKTNRRKSKGNLYNQQSQNTIVDYFFCENTHNNDKKIKICLDLYAFLHSLSKRSLSRRVQYYKENNQYFQPKKRLSVITKEENNKQEELDNFISNYIEEIIYPSPKDGRNVLPQSFTFENLYKEYKLKSLYPYKKLKVYFRYKQLNSSLKRQSIYTDYCDSCTLFCKKIIKCKEEEVLQALKQENEEHLNITKNERAYQKMNIMESKLFNENEQQIIYLDWPQDILLFLLPKLRKQLGKLYFLSKQKIGLLSIVNEKIGKATFCPLSDNDIHSFSKRFNTTISLLFHYIHTYIKKCNRLIIYMDNCPGTNKNNYAFQFFYYLVHNKQLFQEIQISFMVPGHTKFSPDRSFSQLKNIIQHFSEDLETYMMIQ